MTSQAYDAALARTLLLSGASSRPAVAEADVATILQSHALADPTTGALPSAPDNAAAYDVNGAVADVYATKAAQVAGDYSFSADGASYNKGDVLANLLEQEAKFRAMSSGGGVGTTQIGGTNSPYTLDQIALKVIP